MVRVDVATGLVFMLLCAVVIYGTSGMGFWRNDTPGPAFLPFLVAGAGFFVAFLLLIDALQRGDDAEPAKWPDLRGGARVVLGFAGFWLFVLLSPALGFIAAAALLPPYLLIFVQRCPVVPSLACTAAVVVLVYGVFVLWLGLPLPKGVFGI